jgi:formylglycine-generating enzyme required for sulfatase activity
MTRDGVASTFVVIAAIAGAVALSLARAGDGMGARCGAGFRSRGSRCVQDPAAAGCAAPLVSTNRGCDAPDVRIVVPSADFWVGPSDWEAEGRIQSRELRVASFAIDAFETTIGHWRRQPGFSVTEGDEMARAASGMSAHEAEAYCQARGGRLPTEDEWMAAAALANSAPRRYPWGDTGAVCRRGAWGLLMGPCSLAAIGADLVGAHPDGDSSLGIHDLAGNVAEWVTVSPTGGGAVTYVAKGGSWQSALASELRVWSRLETLPGARDPRIGFRCAYSVVDGGL